MNLTRDGSMQAAGVAARADLADSRARVHALLTQAVQAEADAVMEREDPDLAGRPVLDPLRTRVWALLCLRVSLEVGSDGLAETVLLRRDGATWADIGTAAGITRQSAHERWNADVSRVLDRYGDGMLGGPVAED